MKTVRPSVTPYYRLDAEIGWRISDISHGIVEDQLTKQIRLGKRGDFVIGVNEPFGSFGGKTLPTGVTVSESGHILLADTENDRILYYDSSLANKSSNAEEQENPFIPLWKTPEGEDEIPAEHSLFETPYPDYYSLSNPSDVLFSKSGDVVVADSGHGRVIIYSWPELRVRHAIDFEGGQPSALAYDSQGNLFVADRGNGRLWKINTLFNVESGFSGGLGELTAPKSIAIDTDETIFILDAHQSRIFQLTKDDELTQLDPRDSDIFNRQFLVPPFSISEDVITYPQILKPRCEPVILRGVSVDKKGVLVGTFIPLMARARSIHLPRSGVFYSELLDSEVAASQWHRLVIDANVPNTCRLLVQSFASDRAIDDSEVPNLRWSSPFVISTDPGSDIPELLFQNRAGRYLRLRIELLGDGRSTPTISNFQIFGPRASSLKYLPPLFHQDQDSAFFLDRFLSYFDTIQDEVRFIIQDFTRYLDPQGVPEGEFLDWLGKWFDWRFFAEWPTELRREIVSRSIEFFKLRGTALGLKQMLLWHTGLSEEHIQIIEHFRLTSYTGNTDRDCEDTLFIGEKPLITNETNLTHWFTVVLPVRAVADDQAKDTIQRIIDAQKPAHTAYQLCIYTPGVRIGRQSSIGIDTWIGTYPKEPLGSMIVGQSSSLKDSASGIRIGQQLLS